MNELPTIVTGLFLLAVLVIRFAWQREKGWEPLSEEQQKDVEEIWKDGN